MNFNTKVKIKKNGFIYQFDTEDFENLNTMDAWDKNEPSLKLCHAIVYKAIIRFQEDLSRTEIMQLCADMLKISLESLEGTLSRESDFMYMRDGVETHPFPR